MSGNSNDRRFFSTSKKGEIAELKAELNAPNRDQKKDAVKKVIANMTIGKDVSALFMDVINCIQTDNLELKKLVYLYLINYAKSQPDLALAAVNTFVKDASDPNPLIRALAVRTMGCIRVERITEYLCDPLARALRDDDPYVRKTAALCVAKLYDISPSLVRERGFLDQLKELLRDGNSAVVANVVAALNEIADVAGDSSSVFEVDAATLQKLLAALNECTEWGQVFLLEALCRYTPADGREAEGIIERITARLQHANTAVVMSAVKVILTYLPLIDNQDALRLLSRKLAPPLVSLLNSEPEIQYVALRNINLIVQQRPRLLDHEIKVFFCKYNDPIYVKMEKLEIIIKLVSERNVDQVLMELREYAQEVDVDFVRRAVRAIGRCAIKLERAAERCISVLLELIQSGVNYVVQEGIVVIKDIFRRYPNRYESIISTLCENLETLDEPEAKSSMIWIIGEYCDRIDNADDLLDTFLDTFQDETPLVQLQLLTAIVKLYLKREDADVEDMVTQVLNYATQECDNPDLRDRGYLYWRLLSASPEAARTVVLSERPNIGDDTFQLDDQLLDDLVRQLSTLASVYHKPPSSFIMRALPVGGASQGNGDGDDDDEYGSPYIEEEGDEEEKQGNGVGEVDLLSMDDLGFGDSQEEETKGQDAGPSSYPQQSVLSPSDGAGLELIVQSLAPVLNDSGTPCLALSITTINHNGSVSVPKIAFQFNKSFFGFSPANPVLAFDPPLGEGMSSTQRIVLSPVAKLLDQDPASKTSQNVTSLQVAVKNFGNNNVSYFLLPIALPAFLLPSSAFPDAVLDPATLGASWVSIDDSLEVSSMVQNVRSSELNFIKSALGNSSLYYIADRPVPNTADQRFIYFSGQSVDMSTTGAGAETVLVELRTKENTNAVKVSVKTSLPKLSETVLAVITAALCD